MAGFGEPGATAVDAAGLTVGVVAARWHGELTDHMVERAVAAAEASGVREVRVARVSGSVELPVVAQALAREYDVVVALGVVVRGSTAHFDYVCQSVTEGLTRVALDAGKPVGQGVLTVNTIEQARDRAGLPGSAEDKGWAATIAALDAALAIRDLKPRSGQLGFGG
ncbi:6,7-dimethyl-8-ribityllumazine synthase [Micromonospora pisi]|uniref:6,7-dimethyl-8-ribityllumazine synthase n=1 Tax=Micromonospora pisi TaxID=589240 RepID=A0A495JT49_9ACTN|nr:6,7-dimethyl-8-ribityllumazine synthase [Micromonospora pisi]RKR91708.1 6,7-dimethyl-8-ribityllumazine synthase [Micromonospora pisi]